MNRLTGEFNCVQLSSGGEGPYVDELRLRHLAVHC